MRAKTMITMAVIPSTTEYLGRTRTARSRVGDARSLEGLAPPPRAPCAPQRPGLPRMPRTVVEDRKHDQSLRLPNRHSRPRSVPSKRSLNPGARPAASRVPRSRRLRRSQPSDIDIRLKNEDEDRVRCPRTARGTTTAEVGARSTAPRATRAAMARNPRANHRLWAMNGCLPLHGAMACTARAPPRERPCRKTTRDTRKEL